MQRKFKLRASVIALMVSVVVILTGTILVASYAGGALWRRDGGVQFGSGLYFGGNFAVVTGDRADDLFYEIEQIVRSTSDWGASKTYFSDVHSGEMWLLGNHSRMSGTMSGIIYSIYGDTAADLQQVQHLSSNQTVTTGRLGEASTSMTGSTWQREGTVYMDASMTMSISLFEFDITDLFDTEVISISPGHIMWRSGNRIRQRMRVSMPWDDPWGPFGGEEGFDTNMAISILNEITDVVVEETAPQGERGVRVRGNVELQSNIGIEMTQTFVAQITILYDANDNVIGVEIVRHADSQIAMGLGGVMATMNNLTIMHIVPSDETIDFPDDLNIENFPRFAVPSF